MTALHPTLARRTLVLGSSASLTFLPATLLATRQASATPAAMVAATQAFTGGLTPQVGRVVLVLPPLVENGNAVPVTVTVDSPMTKDDHVTTLALFNERNPLPDIAQFTFGPRSGTARVSTRIRLGETQNIIAIARMNDGSFWSSSVEVIVTLPACLERE